MNSLQKFRETLYSVFPIMLVVILLSVTLVPLGSTVLVKFIAGGVLVIFGLTIFLLGVDIGILPVGERSGAALTARKNLPLLLFSAFIIGFIVTIAEPDVQVLADQVSSIESSVDRWLLIGMIAVGIGLFVAIGILRTIISLPLNWILTFAYILVFVLAFFAPKTFQGVSFDSGGATTGPMTVPFIMSLGVGVAAVRAKSDKNNELKNASSNDSFGLTGIASVGPVLAVLVYGILFFKPSALPAAESAVSEHASNPAARCWLADFVRELPQITKEVLTALAPLAVMSAVFQATLLKLPPMQVIRMIRGFIFSFAGLVIFLLGAQVGFMPCGHELGVALGNAAMKGPFWTALLVTAGFVFGAIVVCAEPAVWVLTDQVESITGGTIKRRVMLFALSAGVAFSIALSMLRVLWGFSLWYILVPGYALALILSFITPRLFVGIAFDSGGVASGPMTTTFILSFALGASSASGSSSATDAFGVIALVAMTPLIAIQILGIFYRIKTRRAA